MAESEAKKSRKSAFGHIGTYALGNIVRQLAGFIMLPIYTSHLSPRDYGVVGLLVVMISLFELVVGARFIQALPKFFYEQNTKEGRSQLISTALIITASISVVSCTIVAILSEDISTILLGTPEYTLHVALFGATLLTTAIESYGLTFFRLQERSTLFVINSICKLVVQLGLNIYLVVYEDMGVLGVVISNLIASTIFAIFAFVYVVYYSGLKFKRNFGKSLFIFSWPLWLAGLASLYIGSSNRIFLRAFSSLDDVGFFELSWKFAAILWLLIWNPFSQWWQTERFKLYARQDLGVSVFPVVFNRITLLLGFVGVGIALFSEIVIALMADEAFHRSSAAVPILIISVLFEILASFFLFAFLVRGKTLLITYLRYGSAVIMTLGCIAFIPYFGFIGAALALCISSIIFFFVAMTMSRKFFDSGIKISFFLKILATTVFFVALDQITKFESLLMEILYKSISVSFWMGIALYFIRVHEPVSLHFKATVNFVRSKLNKCQSK